jgi:hypothetical protein
MDHHACDCTSMGAGKKKCVSVYTPQLVCIFVHGRVHQLMRGWVTPFF